MFAMPYLVASVGVHLIRHIRLRTPGTVRWDYSTNVNEGDDMKAALDPDPARHSILRAGPGRTRSSWVKKDETLALSLSFLIESLKILEV
eukprot:768788-Hanusia_phi.AAC.2